MSARIVNRVGDLIQEFIRRVRAGDFNRFIRFAVVGGSGVLVNEGMVALGEMALFAGTDHPLRSHLSVFMGIVVSIFTNFILNDTWTWGDRPKHGPGHWYRRLGLYYAFASVGAAVQYTVTFTLHDWVLTWPLLIANGFGIGCAILINYHFNNRWTFKDRQKTLASEHE